jgi:hypothetical protein
MNRIYCDLIDPQIPLPFPILSLQFPSLLRYYPFHSHVQINDSDDNEDDEDEDDYSA